MQTPPRPTKKYKNHNSNSFKSPSNIPSVSPILKMFLNDKSKGKSFDEVYVSDFNQYLLEGNNPSFNQLEDENYLKEDEKEYPFLFEI